jgi:uncharacterized protein involved in exopolysaccharide biosynthesis
VSTLPQPPHTGDDINLDIPDYGPGPDHAPAGPVFRGPLESVLLAPLAVVLPVVLLVGLAVAAGLVRSPVYSAEARINVGRTDVPAVTLQGTTIGNATLAASYARAIGAPDVVATAAKRAKLSVGDARSALSASPVAKSTLIRVDGDGSSPRQAKLLANGAAKGLISYVIALNDSQRPHGLSARYRRAQRRTNAARQRLADLFRRRAEPSRIARAQLDYQTAQLRSQTLNLKVRQAHLAPGTPTDLQLIQPAVQASSDFWSVLARLGLIGLAVGVVTGVALALVRANGSFIRAHRRRLLRRHG